MTELTAERARRAIVEHPERARRADQGASYAADWPATVSQRGVKGLPAVVRHGDDDADPVRAAGVGAATASSHRQLLTRAQYEARASGGTASAAAVPWWQIWNVNSGSVLGSSDANGAAVIQRPDRYQSTRTGGLGPP